MMTAAMAFFSIALTLNLTGVRLSDLRLSDLRPTAIRSFMERRLTMASTPIIRYYDHLRLVYEVQSRMRELRRTTQEREGSQDQQQNNTQPAARENPNRIPPTKMAVPAWTLRSSREYRRSATPTISRPLSLCKINRRRHNEAWPRLQHLNSASTPTAALLLLRRLRKISTGKEHSMDCVNHSGVAATAYCQNCGKALCASCVRNAPGGQVLCEPCSLAWQNYQQPFVAPPRARPTRSRPRSWDSFPASAPCTTASSSRA